MNRRMVRLAGAALAAMAISSLAIGSTVAAHDGDHDSVRAKLHEVREATEKFKSLTRAEARGYGQPPAPAPLHECISSLDNTGAMGFHFINGALLDGKLSMRHPEVLVYAPNEDGKLKLVALEYVIFQSDWYANHAPGTMPRMFGQMFMATGFPNRYAIPAFFSLHVWLYKHNPAGMFAPFNPNVSCTPETDSARSAGPIVSARAVVDSDAARWQCRFKAATA